MVRLTKTQKLRLEDLKRNRVLYVSHQSPAIMRTFDTLVKKGLASVTEKTPGYGKRYQII